MAAAGPPDADDGLNEFWRGVAIFSVVALVAALLLVALVVWAMVTSVKTRRRLRAAAEADSESPPDRPRYSDGALTDRR